VLEDKPSLEVRNRVQAIQASLHGVPPIPAMILRRVGSTTAPDMRGFCGADRSSACGPWQASGSGR
jgi:hypothetical protein